MSGEVDFERLGRETPWPADAWRAAWTRLDAYPDLRPRLWETVVSMVRVGPYGPYGTADMLVKAVHEPLRPISTLPAAEDQP